MKSSSFSSTKCAASLPRSTIFPRATFALLVAAILAATLGVVSSANSRNAEREVQRRRPARHGDGVLGADLGRDQPLERVAQQRADKVPWADIAAQLGVEPRSLRAAFARWLSRTAIEEAHRELACREGQRLAANGEVSETECAGESQRG